MRNVNEPELFLIHGGLNFFGTTVTVNNPNIPAPIFNEIEHAFTQATNGNWDYSYTMAYLCAEGRMPYYVMYKNTLMDALSEAGHFN